MNLLRQTFQFYQLVRRGVDELSESKYRATLATFSGGISIHLLTDFMAAYLKEPYFNLHDFFPLFYDILKSNILLKTIVRNVKGYYHNKGKDATADLHVLVPYLVERLINEFQSSPSVSFWDMYLNGIEEVSEYISNDLLERAKHRVLLEIIEQYKKDTAQDTDKAIYIWTRLAQDAKFISDTLLIDFAKKLGVDFYLRAMQSLHAGSIPTPNVERKRQRDEALENFLTQEAVNIYDLALLFEKSLRQSFSKEEFTNIIDRVKHDPEMKNYIRGFVYSGLGFFMLDEELNPMDQYYQTISLPSHILPRRLSTLSGQNKLNWQRLFNEFRIIPQ